MRGLKFKLCINSMKKIFFLIIILLPISFITGQAYWQEITTMRYPVTGGRVVFNNSRIEPKFYILGGYSDSTQQSVDWIQEYDLLKNQWKIVGHMNTPRMFFASNVWDSTIIYCGGAEANSNLREGISLWNFYNPTHPSIYDNNFQFDRTHASSQIFEDRFFLIGGNSSTVQNNVSYIIEYDLINKSIVFTHDYSTFENPQDQMTFLVDSTIYIFGGNYNGIHNWIRKFSINSRQLREQGQTLSTPRAGGAAIYNRYLKKAFVIGGYGEQEEALRTVEEINFKLDGSLIISPAAELINPRRNPMVVNYKNTIVVFGGSEDIAGKKIVKKVEQYTDPSIIVINNPPVFTNTDIFPDTFYPPLETTFQFSASDPDGDPLIFSLESGPAGATITKSGLFKWTPRADQAGKTFSITVKVSDGELFNSFSKDIYIDSINTPVEVENESIPDDAVLYQNYPNPFNPTTVISYSLPRNSHVLLIVYDILGREVQRLVDTHKNAGNHSVPFNADNVNSGVYFYKIITDNFTDTKRMLLMK